MKNKELLRTVKFTLFSISAGVIDGGSYALFTELLGWGPVISQILSVSLSVLWNFTLNRRYTFQSASNVPVAMLKVAVFYAAFTPASAWLINYLIGTLLWNNLLAKLVIMLLNLVLEFLYQRFFVFRSSIDTNDRAKKK